MTSKDGGAAFPRPYSDNGLSSPNFHAFHARDGMSLRDWFAGMAMQAIIAKGEVCVWYDEESRRASCLDEAIARGAYIYADALLAERAKGGE